MREQHCTCQPYFAVRHLPDGGTRQVWVCTVHTPGCPVHEPPADEDDHYSTPFEPLPAARTA